MQRKKLKREVNEILSESAANTLNELII